ncbi:MAG: diguanylate cyclase [Magnetococcales bacterium]|nr:diguanylate cyclase [Magnetococcales bacterium]MBF0322179.1 diguanylate cyclase [Magnetococcales bacterium]
MHSDNKKPVVLIVDDEPNNIEVLAKILQSDYRVLFSTQPAKVTELARNKEPDLILLDVVMPGMNGYEVCRQLKVQASTRETPVIFVTAMDEEQYEATGFEAGGVDYVTKPVKPFLLRARVKAHIDLKLKTDLLKKIASMDGLTGIPNRRRLDEFLRQEWGRGLRQGNTPISAILIDVDHFKKFNDHYGHHAGDQCLQKIARCMADTLERSTDLVARYGGEEFACVLPSTPTDGAVHLAASIQKAVADLRIPHHYSDCSDVVTLSMGIASLLPVADQDPQTLLQAADTLLYEAKNAGRNQVKFR